MSAPRKFGLLAVGTSVTTVHTVAYQQQDSLTQIDVANTTAATISLNVHVIPSGGSAATGNALCYGVVIPANGVWHWTGELVMEAATFIQASASATGLTAHFTGRTNA